MSDSVQITPPIIEAPRMLEGEGFEVRRPVPHRGLEAVGPFIMLDHFGPVTYGPGEAKGAPTHPHAGIETLTWLLAGTARHLDSLGNESVMGRGDAQWMRAGRGIIHDEGADEAFQTKGGEYHGVQLWLNMPKGRRGDPPAYRQIDANEIPTFPIGDATVRLMAGELSGHTGPLQTFGRPFLAKVTLPPNGVASTWTDTPELAAYVLTGAAEVNGAVAREGHLALIGGGSVRINSGPAPTELLLLGGEPLDAPIVRYGPFVMNSQAELIDAIRAYNAGKFGAIARA